MKFYRNFSLVNSWTSWSLILWLHSHAQEYILVNHISDVPIALLCLLIAFPFSKLHSHSFLGYTPVQSCYTFPPYPCHESNPLRLSFIQGIAKMLFFSTRSLCHPPVGNAAQQALNLSQLHSSTSHICCTHTHTHAWTHTSTHTHTYTQTLYASRPFVWLPNSVRELYSCKIQYCTFIRGRWSPLNCM